MNFVPIVIGIVLAISIHRDATSRVQRYGRAPWGWPVVVWTLLTFLLGLIAVLVFAFASWRQGKRMSTVSASASAI